jgi:hypothetical protein
MATGKFLRKLWESRNTKVKRSQICGNGIEDEIHFFMLKQIRSNYLSNIQILIDIDGLSDIERMGKILSNENQSVLWPKENSYGNCGNLETPK